MNSKITPADLKPFIRKPSAFFHSICLLVAQKSRQGGISYDAIKKVHCMEQLQLYICKYWLHCGVMTSCKPLLLQRC